MLLFTPGPTPVPRFAIESMSKNTIHHRTSEFEYIFKNTREKLLKLLSMDEVIVLSSSGTGAMQASILNFCKKKSLIINSGKFGERFVKMSQSFKYDFIELKYDWDTPASLEDIKNILDNNRDIDSILIQISESSGGLRHPVEDIAKYVKLIDENIIIIADGITSVAVEKIDTDNIDILITGSQKALMLPPGLGIIGLSKRALKILDRNSDIDFYFNLKSELKAQRKNTTAYTPATTLIIGLNSILEKIEEIGLETLYLDTKNRAKATESSLRSIGLKIYPKNPALSMTSIIDENSENIREILKNKYDINIAGGQDHLKGKIFRINQMGFIPIYESLWVVNAIELALNDLKIRKFDGTANKIFNNIIMINN